MIWLCCEPIVLYIMHLSTPTNAYSVRPYQGLNKKYRKKENTPDNSEAEGQKSKNRFFKNCCVNQENERLLEELRFLNIVAHMHDTKIRSPSEQRSGD